MNQDESNPLQGLPRETVPAPELKRRVIGSLRARGLLGERQRPARKWAALVAVAAALALVTVGFLAGRQSAGGGSGDRGGHRYVLFHYESSTRTPTSGSATTPGLSWRSIAAGGSASAGRVAWSTGRSCDSARLVTLVNGRAEVGAQAVRADQGTLGGYFIITAKDYDEAVAIAKTHPYLKYGGRIAVREIEPT